MNTKFCALVGCLLFGCLTCVTHAATIIGNLSSPSSGSGTLFMNLNQQVAVMFTMGNTSYNLSDVNLRLRDYVTPADVILLALFKDNGSQTNTGALVTNFVAPASSSDTLADFTFTPSTADVTLEANTTYWLRFDYSAVGLWVSWFAPSPTAFPSGSAATFVSYEFSSNNGTSWAADNDVSRLYGLQINGTVAAVPEPSRALLILFAALVGLGVHRNRKTA